MAAELLADKHGAAVYHSRWQELVEVVDRVDCLIVDAPYSERTHAGHDGKADDVNRGADYRARVVSPTGGTGPRRSLDYAAWSPADVDDFVSVWSQKANGWFVSITDHVLAPAWSAALEHAGRYVFAPIAFVASGSRVRLSGDGPAQWSVFIVVARPATKEFFRWGSLPGAYVLPPGHSERMAVVGGKPLWLMERLVEDYSRPGDLVCDPCAGAFTTMKAALRTGRRFVGGDEKLEHARMGVAALEAGVQAPLFTEGAA